MIRVVGKQSGAQFVLHHTAEIGRGAEGVRITDGPIGVVGVPRRRMAHRRRVEDTPTRGIRA